MDTNAERRRRLTHRALPVLGGLAAAALVVGIVVGASADSAGESVARRYAAAWERGDYARMYRQLSAESRSRISEADFTTAYRRTLATATGTAVSVGSPAGGPDGTV